MTRALLTALVLLAAVPAPGIAQSSVQSQFEAGEKALATRNPAQALAVFEGLERQLMGSAKPSPRNLALVRVRLAEARLMTGDYDTAQGLTSSALPALGSEADKAVRFDALRLLARAEELNLDLAAAERHYREALAIEGVGDEQVRRGVAAAAARVTIFSDPARAVRELEALSNEAKGGETREAKEGDAAYWGLLARARLNAGDLPGAEKAIDRAVSLAGGLTRTVSITDIALRSDAALIALQRGDTDKARRYLAYSGTGVLDRKDELVFPAELALPPCGGEIGLKPDDWAIVQFALADSGRVVAAEPILSTRGGFVAVEFAKSAREWAWTSESARQVPTFFRNAVRVQVRCTTAPETQPVSSLAQPALADWVKAIGAPVAEAYAARDTRAALAAAVARHGPSSASLAPFLARVTADPTSSEKEKDDAGRQLLDLVVVHKAPAEAIAYVASNALPWDSYTRPRKPDPLDAVIAWPQIRSSARALAYLDLIRADRKMKLKDWSTAEAMLTQLTSPAGGLAKDDMIRTAASVRLASMAAAAGDRANAVKWFEASGLDPSQCALVDASPTPIRRGGSSKDYPDQVQGFNALVITEFDITTAGTTAKVRPIFSYPPEMFNAAATGIIERSKYAPTYRPDGAPGCTGYRDRVRFASGL